MLKPIEKIVFTPTGEYRELKEDEFTKSDTGSMLSGWGLFSKFQVYTKSIELVQPEYKDGTYYQVEFRNGYKRRAQAIPHSLSGSRGEEIFKELIESGNIYSTIEDAQKVADEINLLFQEKGYFTLFQPNPEK